MPVTCVDNNNLKQQHRHFVDESPRLTNREEIIQFIEQANKHHPTIKFTAQITDTETTFLDTNTGIYKEERFKGNSVLDKRTHFKPTEIFQHLSSCHPPDFSEQTLLKKYLTSLSKILNHAYVKEIIQIILFKGPSQKRNLKTEIWHSFKNYRRANEFCFPFHTIPPRSDELETNPHERLAFKDGAY